MWHPSFSFWILQGCTLFLYESDCRSGIDHNSVPKHALWVENSIVQAVPEHPKKDFVFCLSNSVGDAFLFQVRDAGAEKHPDNLGGRGKYTVHNNGFNSLSETVFQSFRSVLGRHKVIRSTGEREMDEYKRLLFSLVCVCVCVCVCSRKLHDI